MGVSAIIGGALAIGQTIKGLADSSEAKRKAKKLEASKKPITNPYSSLRPHTLGVRQQGQQALRGLATQSQIASQSGTQGQAYIPLLARQNALVGQQIAGNLDQQSARISQLKASGEIYKQNQEQQQYNQEMSGYSNMYNAAQSDIYGGLTNLAGTASTAFGAGGQNQPNAFNQPVMGMNTSIPQQNQTLQFGNNINPIGFQQL